MSRADAKKKKEKKNHNQRPHCFPTTGPIVAVTCPLERPLYEKELNTARCEYMAPSELPLKGQPCPDISETQVRKQSNHNIYTVTAT